MRSRWETWAAALAVLAVGCASPPEAEPASIRVEPPNAATLAGAIAFGVGDLPLVGIEGVVRDLAPARLRAARAPCYAVRWRRGEALALGPVDAFVRATQSAGFDSLSLCVDPVEAPARGGEVLLRPRTPVPPAAHHTEIASAVAALVERYDADGSDDMPGLAGPVDLYVLGSALEPGGVEPFDDYLALLDEVGRAARAAWAEVHIAPAPLRARGVPPGPAADRIERLAAGRGFDRWNLAASGTPTELDAWLAWLAHRAAQNPRPVVVNAGLPAPLVETGAPVRCEREGPERSRLGPGADEGDRCVLAEALRGALTREPEALRWVRARASRDLVQKGVVAASHGVRRIELARVADVGWWTHPALEAGAGLAAWSGLLDRRSGGAHPAFYAFRQLTRHLDGRPQATRLDVGRRDVRMYRLDGPAGPGWVGWLEPRALLGPGALAPAAIVSIETSAPQLRVEAAITQIGATTAEPTFIAVKDGVAWLEVTPTPVFVRPQPAGS